MTQYLYEQKQLYNISIHFGKLSHVSLLHCKIKTCYLGTNGC